MKPLNWALGLLICVFSLSASASAQDSSNEVAQSAPAIAITAYARPALIAQIYDSQGQLESSTIRLGGVEKAVLTVDAWNNPEFTLKTSQGFLYLRRIEIAVRFSGFSGELAKINLTGHGLPPSATTTLVEGPSPGSVVPLDLNTPKLVSATQRTGNRFVRYVGFFSSLPLKLDSFALHTDQLRYEIGVP